MLTRTLAKQAVMDTALNVTYLDASELQIRKTFEGCHVNTDGQKTFDVQIVEFWRYTRTRSCRRFAVRQKQNGSAMSWRMDFVPDVIAIGFWQLPVYFDRVVT